MCQHSHTHTPHHTTPSDKDIVRTESKRATNESVAPTCWMPNEPLSAGLSSGAGGMTMAHILKGNLKHVPNVERVARTMVNGVGELIVLSRESAWV
jgi:hypothetical protein